MLHPYLKLLLALVLVCLGRSFAQPPSNNCGAAINITNFSGGCTSYNSVGSTQDVVTGTCNEGVQNTWFRVTPPNTTMDITVNGAAGSRPEITLGFFNGGNCVTGNWVEVLCADQSGNYASITMNATGLDCSQEYYIFVTNNSDANQGPAQICITATVPPVNNVPTTPAALTGCDTIFVGNNTNANNCGTGFGNCLIPPSTFCSFNDIDNNPATGDPEGADVGFSIENDVWWRFCPTINNASYTLTLTPTVCNSIDGIQLAVLQGASGNMPTLLTGGTNGQNLLIPGPHVFNFTVTNAAAGCVFIEVDGFAGTQCTFTMNLNCTANCPVCILPATLIRFDGAYDDGQVFLDWETQDERNLSHYEVERLAADGRFEHVADLPSNNSWVAYYHWADPNPRPGTNQYRLRLVDENGSFEYSDVVAVQAEREQEVVVWPSPFEDVLQITFHETEPSHVSVRLYDMSGRLVLQQALTQLSAGTTEIDTRELERGVYLYTVTVNDRLYKGQVLKQ